jgi:hypothetical protein
MSAVPIVAAFFKRSVFRVRGLINMYHLFVKLFTMVFLLISALSLPVVPGDTVAIVVVADICSIAKSIVDTHLFPVSHQGKRSQGSQAYAEMT